MSKPSQFFLQIPFILAIFCLFTVSTASARQQLHGHVPQEASTAPFLGAMDTTATLNLAISLPLQNQDELQQFLKDVYNPQSPFYHHFLTPDEFAQRFGASDSDYQSVIDFAKAHNLIITNTYPNHLLVDVQGSVSDIQKTFHVNLKRYQRPDGSVFHAPDQEPSVDLDVALIHVSGLENFHVPKPSFKKIEQTQQTSSLFHPNQGTGPKTGGIYPYFGTDFRNAYTPCLSALTQGAGQTVAVVEFSSYYTADISSYVTAASLSTNVSTQITNVGVDSFDPTSVPLTSSGDIEASLDIELLLCMAQSSQLYVYEAANNGSNVTANDMLTLIATSPTTVTTAKQISCSWTGFGDAGTSIIFSQFAAQGQSFFQAAGDSGAYVTGDLITTVPGPMNVSSELTVVGGTELTTSGAGGVTVGTYINETTWNQGGGINGGAGSGGICNGSSPVAIPTYQVPFVNSANKASAVDRNIPDVSLTAFDIEVYAENNGPDGVYGGTSCATPLWAGFTALINEQAGVKGPMGFRNPALYFLAQNFYSNDFNDITTGNNNLSGASTLYTAVAGYDLATGLGSPKCNHVADMINPPPTNTPTITPTLTN